MNANATSVRPGPEIMRGVRKRFVQIGILILLQAALLFGASGDLRWFEAWVYLVIYAAVILLNTIILLPRSPEMIAERAEMKPNTKTWDKIVSSLVSFVNIFTLIVAGLQERFTWEPSISLPIQIIGLALYVFGFLFFIWAMASNAFFASVVRIQEDRGHAVATGGPYRLVRHPGYVGMILAVFGTALLLGSVWALIPAAGTTALLIVRTALEDRTLRAELPGYEAFTHQTRYRLLPGIW